MEPKGFHRKLAAILSADVAGYTRLMQNDEAATVSDPRSSTSRYSPISSNSTAAGWSIPQGTTCWRSSRAWWTQCSAR